MHERSQEIRKKDHIDLALKAQINHSLKDERFFYEPLFSSHPKKEMLFDDDELSLNFLDKKLKAPLWVSSMTGGVGEARHINLNLAKVCHEFGLGMGLGSCRILLEGRGQDEKIKKYFNDFNLRPFSAPNLPFFINLGIAQVEELLLTNELEKIENLIRALSADGVIIHINPLQEWFQPEGDRLILSPIETLEQVCSKIKTKIIVKEVGQGLGPKSLRALLNLPIAGIELAGFGGTNFTRLEQIRNEEVINKTSARCLKEFSFIGHSANEMVDFLNEIKKNSPLSIEKDIIISGGIKNILDGYYLKEKLEFNSVIGQAKNFLIHAENYQQLKTFVMGELEGLKLARRYLIAKKEECRYE